MTGDIIDHSQTVIKCAHAKPTITSRSDSLGNLPQMFFDAQMATKWDKETAKDVCAWIQRATDAIVPSDDPIDFAEALKNGQTLCQYVFNYTLSFWRALVVTFWRYYFCHDKGTCISGRTLCELYSMFLFVAR